MLRYKNRLLLKSADSQFMKDLNKRVNATVTSGGRITIPKPIRDRLDLRPGDKIRWGVNKDGEIILQSSPHKQ